MTDELEFATKEDLEEIQKNPALQRIYNAMRAGVTKKFQEWAEKGKAAKELESKIKDLENRLYEWEDWYATTFPDGWSPDLYTKSPHTQNPTTQSTQPRSTQNITIDDLIEAINKAGAMFEQRLNQLTDNYNRLSNAFTLSLDLIEQKFAHPDMDIQRVLKTAVEKGLTDFGTAYEFAYKDELTKRQIDEEVKKRLEEKEVERKKAIETGSGALPLTFERPKEVPKSFTEATQQFLAERAREGESGK